MSCQFFGLIETLRQKHQLTFGKIRNNSKHPSCAWVHTPPQAKGGVSTLLYSNYISRLFRGEVWMKPAMCSQTRLLPCLVRWLPCCHQYVGKIAPDSWSPPQPCAHNGRFYSSAFSHHFVFCIFLCIKVILSNTSWYIEICSSSLKLMSL